MRGSVERDRTAGPGRLHAVRGGDGRPGAGGSRRALASRLSNPPFTKPHSRFDPLTPGFARPLAEPSLARDERDRASFGPARSHPPALRDPL